MQSFFTYILDRIEGKAEKGQRRSPEWPKVREIHLRDNPACAICGKMSKVQVHHKVPFNIAPDLELQPDNLISLCTNKPTNCHLTFGHLKDFRATNTNIDIDAMVWRVKFENARNQVKQRKSLWSE